MENEVVVEDVKEIEVIEEVNIIVEEVSIVEEVVEAQKQMLNFDLEYCRTNGITKDVIRRFWKKIGFPENRVDECWIWQAGKDSKGYGSFRVGSKQISSHRFAYMIFKGEINEGLLIRHTCDNPYCVNPHHLLEGSCQDNMNDKVNRDRQTSGEDVWVAKLTEKLVDEILAKLLQKISRKSLAVQYDVSEVTISEISTGKRWKKCYKKLSVDQQWQLRFARFLPEENEKIRELYKNTTMTQINLAKQFKVSVSTIVKIIRRVPPYDY